MRGESGDDRRKLQGLFAFKSYLLKQTCTENPERLRQLTACTVMILFVFKTNQHKRALKYKFDEEKLSGFFSLSFLVSCEKLMAHQVKGCHSCLSLYSNEREHLSFTWEENWQLYKIAAGGATVETLLDWLFSMLGWGREWDRFVSALV